MSGWAAAAMAALGALKANQAALKENVGGKVDLSDDSMGVKQIRPSTGVQDALTGGLMSAALSKATDASSGDAAKKKGFISAQNFKTGERFA